MATFLQNQQADGVLSPCEGPPQLREHLVIYHVIYACRLTDYVPEYPQKVEAEQLAQLILVEPALCQLGRDVRPVCGLVEVGHPVLVAQPVLRTEAEPVEARSA